MQGRGDALVVGWADVRCYGAAACLDDVEVQLKWIWEIRS
jgi:hypothetical protein